LASRLLKALQDGNFSAERFEYVERLERGLLQYNDDLVNSSFIAFSHFRLWNAMFRVWGAFIAPGVMRLTRARLLHVRDGDERHFAELENSEHPGLWWAESGKVKRLLESAAETCEKYEVGELTGDQAADTIFQLLDECDVVNPIFGWKDPTKRFVAPTTATMARFLWWASVQGPPEMKKLGREFVKGVLRAGVKARKVL
jgi:FADH2 O2-dependent halogenase